MSRGPGRWQRAVLAELEDVDLVPVGDLAARTLGRLPARSEMVSLRRAVMRLAETGACRAVYAWQCERCLVVYDPPPAGCCGKLRWALCATRDASVRGMAPQRHTRVVAAQERHEAAHTRPDGSSDA